MAGRKTAERWLCALLTGLLLLGAAPSGLLGKNGSKPDLQEMSPADRQAILDKKAELEGIQQEIGRLRARRNQVSGQRQGLSSQIRQKEDEAALLEDEVALLDRQIAEASDNIGLLKEQIGVKEADLERRTAYLNGRLYSVYVDGEPSVWDVMFSSASLTDFLTRYDLLARVVDRDTELMVGLKADRALLNEDKYGLEIARKAMEADKKVRQEKAGQLRESQSQLQGQYRELTGDLQALEAAVAAQEADCREIQRFVSAIQDKYKAAYMGQGTMGWPLASYVKITSPYGYRQHPILNKKRFHSGVDIAAYRETAILAAETGKVIMASRYGGFGKTVIIDHGGGVSTQYSHMNSIAVAVGDLVTKGQRLGGVGTTGLSTGNHLHFQIMINGKTIDPMGQGKYYIREP